ncbi:hypothetical protein CHELA41_24257 [Hyphomicrobiales bacterium]|nr:hypothetical protein CHELA41_24257 [Hyphomicrobiales bacterium]
MVAGALRLSSNIGRISGASLMGAIFGLDAGAGEFNSAIASNIAVGCDWLFPSPAKCCLSPSGLRSAVAPRQTLALTVIPRPILSSAARLSLFLLRLQ